MVLTYLQIETIWTKSILTCFRSFQNCWINTWLGKTRPTMRQRLNKSKRRLLIQNQVHKYNNTTWVTITTKGRVSKCPFNFSWITKYEKCYFLLIFKQNWYHCILNLELEFVFTTYLTFYSFHRKKFYIFPRKRGPPPWYLTYFATINCDDSCCVEATKNRQKIISYIRLQMWYEFRRHASFNHFSLNSILNLGISSG